MLSEIALLSAATSAKKESALKRHFKQHKQIQSGAKYIQVAGWKEQVSNIGRGSSTVSNLTPSTVAQTPHSASLTNGGFEQEASAVFRRNSLAEREHTFDPIAVFRIQLQKCRAI